MYKLKASSLSTSILLLFLCFNVHATEITWTGNGATSDWNDPLNWDLLRVPVAADSVFTFYGDNLSISSGYTARCMYFKLLGDLDITTGGKLTINNGRFDALGDVINDGTIRINDSSSEGMIFSSQAAPVTFENYGEIFIDNAQEQGLAIYNDQVFSNNGGGVIEITNSTLESLIINGELNNNAILKIGASNNEIAINMILSNSIINNQVCARIVALGQIVIPNGELNNYGFFKQNYDGDNDIQSINTTINNHAIIEDIHASFVASDFDIQSIWLREIQDVEVNTGEPITPFVNELPPLTTFSDIYTDNLLTTHAGTYDVPGNIWTPNANANGLTKFYLEIGQSGGICKDTVRFDLLFPVLETVYWTGGSGNWQFGFNWSTGSVPSLTEEVAIYHSTDDVFIPLAYTANAKNIYLGGKLTLQFNSTLNVQGSGAYTGIEVDEGELINNGNLIVDGCTYGIDIDNGTLTNNQNINFTNNYTCIAIDQFSNKTAFLNNSGTIENDSGDLINGDDSEITNSGMMVGKAPNFRSIYSLNLINDGSIELLGNGMTGIGLEGIISNTNTGSIFAENFDIGLEIEGSNQGSLEAERCDTGIKINDDFDNHSSAEIIVSNSDIGLEAYGGNFNNLQGGSIVLKRNDQFGMYIPKPFVSASYIYNNGQILIDTTQGIGLLCSNDIINQGIGKIEVRNSGLQGFHILTESAAVTNKDQGLIEVIKSDGHALMIEGGKLFNEGEAEVILDSTLMTGIHLDEYDAIFTIYYGVIENSATIEIGSTINSNGIFVESGSSLTNEECSGKIINNKNLTLNGTFINNGIYSHFTMLPSAISSPIENNGIIKDPQKILSPSNINNNGIYIGQKSGLYTEDDTINNILSTSPPIGSSFVIDNSWYLDKNLSTLGGQFQASQNSLLLNSVAVDSSTFYFRVYNASCTPNILDTVSLNMEIPIGKICKEIVWSGGKGFYSNSGNWIGNRLPSACDTLKIGGALDSVFINTTQAIEVGMLQNKGYLIISPISNLSIKDGAGNGIENEGAFYNRGILDIENINLNGYLGLPNAILINEGSISIRNTMENGMETQQSLVRNLQMGTMSIENALLEGLKLGMGSVFYQNGYMILN